MSKINKKDIEYMSDASAAAFETVSSPAHYVLWGLALFIFFAIAWSYFATLEVLTRANGKVVSSSNMQIVSNLEGGIIREIMVKEGQEVEKNQVLLVIDDTNFSSTLGQNLIQIYTLKAKMIRLQAEANGAEFKAPKDLVNKFPKLVEHEYKLYLTRKQEMEASKNILASEIEQKKNELESVKRKQEQVSKSLELVEKELAITYPLVPEGAVPEVELLRLERMANDLRGEHDAAKLAVPRIEESLKGATHKYKEMEFNFKSDAQEELNKVETEIASLTKSSIVLKDRVSRAEIRSPIKGVVNQINFKTIGGVIQPGEDIVEIVPRGDTLLIEAEVKPQDIGFVNVGQKAKVKITAFDFSVYGGLDAVIENITPDTIFNKQQEYVYLVTLRTEKSYLTKGNKRFAIKAGMRASVDILTGHKTVLEYILKPIIKTTDRALSER